MLHWRQEGGGGFREGRLSHDEKLLCAPPAGGGAAVASAGSPGPPAQAQRSGDCRVAPRSSTAACGPRPCVSVPALCSDRGPGLGCEEGRPRSGPVGRARGVSREGRGHSGRPGRREERNRGGRGKVPLPSDLQAREIETEVTPSVESVDVWGEGSGASREVPRPTAGEDPPSTRRQEPQVLVASPAHKVAKRA